MGKKALWIACGVAWLCAGQVGAQVTVPSVGVPDMNAALSQVPAGGTITVTTDLEEDGTYLIGQAVTLRGQHAGITLRNMGFLVTAGGVVFRDLVIDGKDSQGRRNPARRNLIRVTPTAGDFTMENCRVVHPASGEGDGLAHNAVSLHGPGSALQLEMGTRVTLRNCDFNNAVDAGIDNEVNVFFTSVDPAAGPILIEGCTFGAHSRGIQINTPHANITIRNNTFLWSGTAGEFADEEVTGVMLTTDFNDLSAANGPRGAPLRNMLVEGNRFGGPGFPRMNNSGLAFWGPVEGLVIRNNTFNNTVVYEAIQLWDYGRDVILENNYVAPGSHQSGCYVIGARSKQLTYGDPDFRLDNVVIAGETFAPVNGSGMTITEMTYGVRIENCFFNQCAMYGFWTYASSNQFVLRACTFTGCGARDTGVDGAVVVQSEGSVVADNVMLDCRNGVSFDPEREYFTPAGPIRRPNRCVVAGNYMLRCTRYGIEDTNGSALDPGGQAVGIRIVNNTITLPGVGAMALRSRDFDVFNNIMHGGPVAITTTTFSPTFRRRGFNLNYGNAYQGMSATATDKTANPQFAGGLSPAGAADVALLPGSPARNAGSADGLAPDYRTENGAWQEVAITASAPAARWERYR
ncbi:right-handed parallel beta-helix repeat-containing protein [bacterium]|nr:right-handed parallel beta-helix repeat-containing protein [bacterium]